LVRILWNELLGGGMPKLAPVPCQLIGQLTDLIILFLYNLGQMLVLLLGLFQGPMVHFPETGQFRIQLIALLEKHLDECILISVIAHFRLLVMSINILILS